MLGLTADWAVANGVVIAAVCVGLCGLSVGLGARFAVLDERNPARIAGGVGGTINLIASVVFVCLVLAAAAYAHWHAADQALDHLDATCVLILVAIVAGSVATAIKGDPQVIARRRAVQRQLILNRLSSAVPEADVVVTNPTELAVALKYDPDTMPAPVVVAKGAGVIAQRIRRLALENGIPIVERKPLAQALYANIDVNQSVPTKTAGCSDFNCDRSIVWASCLVPRAEALAAD